MINELKINLPRLERFISDMAKIGGTEKGGCNRQALTSLDKEGRELFLSWCSEIGGVARLDSMGNLFVRFYDDRKDHLPVLIGSHLDTQPTGGKYDGIYGVLGALEVLYTLKESGLSITHPIDIVVWANEEGARFSPAMSGSGVFANKLNEKEIYQSTDEKGITYHEALLKSDQLGDICCNAFPFKAALELHIEQGPILEAENKPIGIVSGVQGMHWYEITLKGKSVHAGPTPMTMRHDPIKGMSEALSKLYQEIVRYGDDARLTIGKVATHPSSPNTVPETVTFTIDVRHPNQTTLNEMSHQFEQVIQDVTATHSLGCDIKKLWQSPAVEFSPQCIDAIHSSCKTLDLDYLRIVSGAGHDSVYLSYVGPVGMIFVPCEGGISHNEAENVASHHIEAGANVLLHSVIKLVE
ncbi:Zn-dependent hydrolase [Vibrio sp.]|uniref:Zn-dependent hydrolase n=1 Tax=Vibrio viridaestus TaxID=2487322 RepID=A0A3N9TFJ0_9VIBR|nr:Zn-dependent hydrolase [Vibrio viridaestus]MDC0610194.1 Zn-dependent hydrolase [Vibrio sp.]RQW62225.1 Zn-dependent hydrolase [Vibrio viridaestus]